VNDGAAIWGPPSIVRYRRLFPAILAAACLVTVAAAVVSDGNIGFTAAPLALAALLGVVWFLPLRIPLLCSIFLGLAIDAGDGPWASPAAPLGHLLFHNLNKVIPVDSLSFPAIIVFWGYLLLIHLHRTLSGSRIDAAHVKAASPVFWAMAFSILTAFVWIALGYKRGGDVKMAKNQVQALLLMLGLAYLLMVSLRGVRDFRVVGGLLLGAASIKALIAMWTVYVALQIPPAFATSHGDSILFASATILLVARFVEAPVRRRAAAGFAFLPLLVGGMLANNRRIVWAEVLAALVLLFVMSRRTRFKQRVSHALLASIPVLVLYFAAGWESNAQFFAPVKTLRSMGDADVDSSTLFRDIEDYNLIQSINSRPFLGTGFGVPFPEVVPEDDISFFKEYHFLPHNSVLGLWAFLGMLGFTGLTTVLVICGWLAARSHAFARSPGERLASVMVLSVLLINGIQCWGDIGFSEGLAIFLVAPVLAVAGQLAQSTGAWRVSAPPLSQRAA
jgi:hypothetical protein